MKFKSLIFLCLSVIVPFVGNAQVTETAHPWKGKTVAYFGDSVSDPRNDASQEKYWSYLNDWLGITPYVYAVSGRQWNDIPRQTGKLRSEHGEDFDAIMIFMGTNDYNHAVPIGRWYDETLEAVEYGHQYAKREENVCAVPPPWIPTLTVAAST